MKNNKGMTMVEVLMGFVILLLFMGMLSGIIAAANNIYLDSVDLQRAEESLQRKMYEKNMENDAQLASGYLTLVPETDMPGDKTPIPLHANLYCLSSEVVLEQTDADVLAVKMFFLKRITP